MDLAGAGASVPLEPRAHHPFQRRDPVGVWRGKQGARRHRVGLEGAFRTERLPVEFPPRDLRGVDDDACGDVLGRIIRLVEPGNQRLVSIFKVGAAPRVAEEVEELESLDHFSRRRFARRGHREHDGTESFRVCEDGIQRGAAGGEILCVGLKKKQHAGGFDAGKDAGSGEFRWTDGWHQSVSLCIVKVAASELLENHF